MSTTDHIHPNFAHLALGVLGLALPSVAGCSSEAGENPGSVPYESSIESLDASLAVASEVAPDEEQLCSLRVGQTHYAFARAILGSPSVFLFGSYLHYVYGSQPTVKDGLQDIGLIFGPDEIFEGATTHNVPMPSCWADAEIEDEYQRKELPSLMEASALFQSADDYPPLPSEEQLCQIAVGTTLAKDVWFDILPRGFMRIIRMGPRDSVIDFRYGDRESERVVSLYFYFSTSDANEDNDLFFPLERVVAYNMAALPACWQ